jgi:hypothetical protein
MLIIIHLTLNSDIFHRVVLFATNKLYSFSTIFKEITRKVVRQKTAVIAANANIPINAKRDERVEGSIVGSQ